MDPDTGGLLRLVARLRARLAFVESSRFWKARALWLKLRARLGRPATDEPEVPVSESFEGLDESSGYARWLDERAPRAADLATMRETARHLERRPTIAIIVDDVRASVERELAAAAGQAYPFMTVMRTSTYNRDASKFRRFEAAFRACSADIVAFCEPGNVATPNAAFEIAIAWNEAPDAVAAYGDRDVRANGSASVPIFAPDWSPEAFLCSMYTGSFVFFRRDAVERVGLRDGFGDALLYDLALRVCAGSAKVVHRQAIIVHEHRSSQNEADGDADADADLAVIDALAQRGLAARADRSILPNMRVLRFGRPAVAVDVIIPTRDLPEKLERCLQSVYERNADGDLRVTVVDNGSVLPETQRLLSSYARERPHFRILRIDEPFNFSRLINAAVRATSAPLLLLLNNDTTFSRDGGIATLAEYAALPDIGAVGARLLYADGSIQHAGVVVGIGGLAGHVYRGLSAEAAAQHSAVTGVRNYSAVTAACLMVRRTVFEAAGGFDERLAVEFNDVDFCLRLLERGLRNVYLPHVVLFHEESSTRGVRSTHSATAKRERRFFRERWQSGTFADPYYNAALTVEREDGSLAP